MLATAANGYFYGRICVVLLDYILYQSSTTV